MKEEPGTDFNQDNKVDLESIIRGKVNNNTSKITQCPECRKTFSKRSNLTKHMKTFHPDKEIPGRAPKKATLKCTECVKLFTTISNLRRHLRKCHPNKADDLAPMRHGVASLYKYTCDECGRNFNVRKCYSWHLRQHMPPEQRDRAKKVAKKCPLCDFAVFQMEEVLQHFKEAHHIDIVRTDMEFESMDDFHAWKTGIERDTKSRYVKLNSEVLRSRVNMWLYCHRSGNFRSRSQGLRKLKSQGSVKINGYCPASMRLTKNRINDKVNVQYIETHVGHSCETELEHLVLTKEQREQIAVQIADKVPFEDIIENFRQSCSAHDRLQKLTRKDLHNIKNSFKLKQAGQVSRLLCSEVTNGIETWVNEMKEDNSCVLLFYKPQGIVPDDLSWLRSDDFVLMFMTATQRELLKKFGPGCVCVDVMRGPNNNNFGLHTLFVLDGPEGLPCSFCLTNRADREVFKLFFWHVAEQTGMISTEVFMSDFDDFYLSAWKDVMGKPGKRLFCSWHVNRVWRNHLYKVKPREKELEMHKHLRSLLKEQDYTLFYKSINEFCEKYSDDPNTSEFAKYFVEHFTTNYDSWAFSYRQGTEIAANLTLERMHKALTKIYLKEKHARRFDKAILAIMEFVQDKLGDREEKVEYSDGDMQQDIADNDDEFGEKFIIHIVENESIMSTDQTQQLLLHPLKRIPVITLDEEKEELKKRIGYHLDSIQTFEELEVVKGILAPILFPATQ